MSEHAGITPRAQDFSAWYNDAVMRAELADYSPVRGCMVIRPNGYAIWELMQRALDDMFKATGHRNAYFPLLIPQSFLEKEAQHVEGFAPEVAVVTRAGGKELDEPLVLRPTSETIIYDSFAKWIHSYRDLPLLINQWANIVRWEMRTRLFLRTTEFLWQEGHTAHETGDEAQDETMKILALYKEFVETELAIPVVTGKKTEWDKFAGAVDTYAVEALMGDGKALQMGTSHNLGQHFSRVFNIRYEDRDQNLQFVWQTSWGVSTRLIGAAVMAHGDDSGLRLPPAVAPIQVVIVPISMGNWKQDILPIARNIEADLVRAGLRVKLDAREEFTPGWKFSDWEMRGVPLRLEIGPRDVKDSKVIAVRRDIKKKDPLPMAHLTESVPGLLADIQKSLFNQAEVFLRENTRFVEDYEGFKATIEAKRGFLKAFWCGARACEEKIKGETMASIRVIPLERSEDKTSGRCLSCGQEARTIAYFARSY